MTEQDNVQVVRRAYAAFQKGDITGLLDLVAEDADWSHPGPPEAIPFRCVPRA